MNTDINKMIENITFNNGISHAYLLNVDNTYETENAITLIKNIIKASLSKDKQNRAIEAIESNSSQDLKIIRSIGKYIKKEQISELIKEFGNKSIEDNIRFYIIEYAEDLNLYSANALLKFLEEPENNIVAVLVTKSINMILPTIISRCQIINANYYKAINISDEKKEIYKNTLVNILKHKQKSISYLKDIYLLKQEELIEMLSFFYEIFDSAIDNKMNDEEDSFLSNILSDEYTIILFKKIQKSIEYLKNNVNTRIVLDYLILGGDIIDEN